MKLNQLSNSLRLNLASGALAASCVAISLSSLLLGCGSSSKRMGEAEALSYKQSLIAEHAGELSPEDRYLLMMHPGRTRAELDEAVEMYRTQHQNQARDRGWALRYTWRGEERESEIRNPEGAERFRVSELIGLPSGTEDAIRMGIVNGSSGSTSAESSDVP